MKIRSIFVKFILSMMFIIIIFAAVIFLMTGKMINSAFEISVTDESRKTSDSIARIVEEFMDKAYAITEELATSEDMLIMDMTIQSPMVKKTAANNPYFELIYIQDMNGDQTARSSGTLGNRANRWWFIQMLAKKKPFVSKSYYSVSTNMTCASIFYPMMKDGEMIGIFATDLKLSDIQSLVEEYSNVDEGEITFIIDGEGNVIAHPVSTYYEELYNYKTQTKTVSKKDSRGNVLYDTLGNIITEEIEIDISDEYVEIISKVMNGYDGTGEVAEDGINYYVSYSPIQLDGDSDTWSVITLKDKSKAMSIVQKINRMILQVTLVAICISFALVAIVTGSITKPIKLCVKRIERLSEGDLVTEVPVIKGKDEAARLLECLNVTVSTMKQIIKEINVFGARIAEGDFSGNIEGDFKGEFGILAASLKKIAESMSVTMSNVNFYAEQFMRGTEFFDETAGVLAEGTSTQAVAVEELSESLQDISAKLKQNAEAAENANMLMKKVDDNIKINEENLKSLIVAMNEIETNSKDISGISKTLQSIATQTHLLSLNASVEATRAGEAGKAFAVIVTEIRELAVKCAEAANSTSALIEKTNTSVYDGMEHLNDTVESIKQMSEENKAVVDIVDDISRTTAEEAEAIEQITNATSQINDVTQNNSSYAAQNAEKSREMRKFVEELTDMLSHYRC